MTSGIEDLAGTTNDLMMEEFAEERANSKWISHLAFSAMVMAMIAAMGALLGGITANQAMVQSTAELLTNSQLSEDRLTIEVMKSKHEILESIGKPSHNDEIERVQADEAKMIAQMKNADLKVQNTVLTHEIFAIGTTLLSIAITLCGMSIVTRRKSPWAVGLVFSAVGAACVAWGVLALIV